MAFNTTLNTLEPCGSSFTTISASQMNSTIDDQYSNNNNTVGSGGFITKVSAETIRSVINCYLIPPVALFGLIGNVLSLIILGGKKMRQFSTNIVLAYLAFIDILLLLIVFMRKVPCLVAKADPITAQNIDYVMLTAPGILEFITSRTSSLLSLVICCERFIAVFKPLKVKLWVTPKRMIFSVVTVTVIVIGLVAVDFSYATVSFYYDNTKNRTLARINYQTFYLENQLFFNIYNNVFLAVLLRILPMFLITIPTVAIITQMRRRMRWLKDITHATQNSNSENDIQAVTKMLMTVVSVYIICNVPGSISIFISLVDRRFTTRGEFGNTKRAVSSMASFLSVLNSSANFIVYIVLNKKFSDILVQMLCGFLKKSRRYDHPKVESVETMSSTLRS
ncbi:hypothetical protein SNE40_001907 [Patella caerulea]|uniref:G-protein coupled receptors family 1 profile domain-containing protein n=1 Tax=Patella caerulea TaxID=87958 RepID=A0AAN8Q6V2_PATCE